MGHGSSMHLSGAEPGGASSTTIGSNGFASDVVAHIRINFDGDGTSEDNVAHFEARGCTVTPDVAGVPNFWGWEIGGLPTNEDDATIIAYEINMGVGVANAGITEAQDYPHLATSQNLGNGTIFCNLYNGETQADGTIQGGYEIVISVRVVRSNLSSTPANATIVDVA